MRTFKFKKVGYGVNRVWVKFIKAPEMSDQMFIELVKNLSGELESAHEKFFDEEEIQSEIDSWWPMN